MDEAWHRVGAVKAWWLLTLPALGFLAGCQGDTAPVAGAAIMPVQVVEATRTDVPLYLEMVGATLGNQDVPIRARVEGFLETMDFQEGGFVEKGHLLYTIDPQPFQAKLVEAQSLLAAAQTSLAKAQSDLARIKPLAEMKAVSEQDLDAAVAQEAAARAGVRASRAGQDLAEIELSYSRIHAPIAGRIGLTQARPGEFVGREPNPVVLNTLSDINPIRVRFSISEREYLILAKNHVTEVREDATRADLTLLLADGTEHPEHGEMIASAHSINPDTGTYTLEALFKNPTNVLIPGQFARVRALYETLEDATVVPRKALVELQGRFQLYLVNASNQVEVREVTLGPAMVNDIVIESGLNGGERIIVEGLQKVRPGMTVDPKPLIAANPAPVPAT
jgi:membrane fusion protein (multidrug efflux system)